MVAEAVTDDFWSRLETSKPYVAATARYLRMAGRHCAMYPMRRDATGRHDQHDLGMLTGIEVKARHFDFRTLAEFMEAGRRGRRFPSVIVDTRRHVDGNLHGFMSWPAEYWIWSRDRGAVVIIDVARTHAHWAKRWLRIRGMWKACYVCPFIQDAGRPVWQERDVPENPKLLDGVELWTAEALADVMLAKRQAAEILARRLDALPWVTDDGLQEDNPGIPR